MSAAVDHLLVAVDDLDAAVDRWRRAGFTVEEGGRHARPTHNALIRGSALAYLELICALDPESDPIALRVRESPGPLSWALRVDDIAEVAFRLTRDGFGQIADRPIEPGERTTPDGNRLTWSTLDLASRPLDSHLPFLIQWDTPMAPAESGFALRGMHLEVPDPEMTARLLTVCGLTRSSADTLTDGVVEVTIATGGRGLTGVRIDGIEKLPAMLDNLCIVSSSRVAQ